MTHSDGQSCSADGESIFSWQLPALGVLSPLRVRPAPHRLRPPSFSWLALTCHHAACAARKGEGVP
jgi:hypothetical protein